MSDKDRQEILKKKTALAMRFIRAQFGYEKGLEMMLECTIEAFTPTKPKEARVILRELSYATSKTNAIDSIWHLQDHPETAKACIDRGQELLAKILPQVSAEMTSLLCKEYKLPDPFAESSINEKTRQEVLDMIRREESQK